MDLGIFQIAVDLAPIQAFAHNHPLAYAAGAFAAGSALPTLWNTFLTKWLPNGTIKAVKFLRDHGMTTDQLKELNKAIEIIDHIMDDEVARGRTNAVGKADSASEVHLPSEPPASPPIA